MADDDDNVGDDVGVQLLGMVVSDSEDEVAISDGERLIGSADSTVDESVDASEVYDEPVKHYYCGLLWCRPRWLQPLANKKLFTTILFLFSVVESSIVSGFTSIVLSSLEKRYQFSSTAAGSIAISYDSVAIFTAVIVSFLGGRPNSHKPRWLGGSLVVMGTGAFIFASPQFLFGSYDPGRGSATDFTLEVCQDNRNMTSNCGPSNNLAYTIYIIGNVFIASGAAALYTLGPAFIDEIVFPKYVSLHIGAYHLGGLVGPGFGYIIGSLFLLVYVDPWVDTPLVPSDPAWVGGWWMGFVLAGVLSMLLSVLFFMYPKSLKDSHLVKIAREKEMVMKHTYRISDGGSRVSTVWELVKSLCAHLKRLVLNKSFMFQNLSVSILFIVVAGLASFGPQYLETQLHLTASTAGLLSGGLSILAASTGVFVGAIVIHKAELKGRRLALFIAVILTIIVLPSPALLMYCGNPDIAGVNTPYVNGSTNGIDGSSCNIGCECQSSVYEPVCGDDGITYFSPCRAGCRVTPGDNTNFTRCSCVADSIYHRSNNSVTQYSSILMYNSTASLGACKISCLTPGIVIVGVAIATIFLAFVAQIPVIYFTMRVVADEERPLALGLQSSMSRIFGSIPGPLLFGTVFDSSCVKWQDVCDERGNCWIYDNFVLSRRVFYLVIPSLLAAVAFSYLSWIFHPKTSVPHPHTQQTSTDKP